jgi:hypothetical protein
MPADNVWAEFRAQITFGKVPDQPMLLTVALR